MSDVHTQKVLLQASCHRTLNIVFLSNPLRTFGCDHRAHDLFARS